MKQGRRAVLDDARRRVERALMVAEVADELAAAAHAVVDADGKAGLGELRAVLTKYERIIST